MSHKLSDAIRAINKSALLCTSVSALAFFGAAVQAQENTNSAASGDTGLLEEVTVTAIRQSLRDSIETKRNSNAVVDSVTSEDVGKFPDNNLAEALGRIPGVAVSRQFGGGDAVSIRGASNQLTLTTLNGQSVASTGWYSQQAIDRSFNFSMLPSELIAGMDVYKSSRADLVEGGVGGTVVVKTRKPLDMDSHTVYGSISETYSSASEDWDPSVSGLYSFKNDAESFGVLVAASTSDYDLNRRGDEGLPVWGGRVAPTQFEQNRERTAFDVTLQAAPTDNIEITLHHLDLELEADNVNTAVWVPQDLSNCTTNAQGAPILCDSTAGAAGTSFVDVRPRFATMASKATDLQFEYQGDTFTFSAQAGRTEATGGTEFETNFGYLTTTSSTDGVVDATGDTVDFQFDPSMQVDDLPAAGGYAGWEGLQTSQVVNQPNTDEETYYQFDLELDVDFGVISAIKTGVRSTEHKVEQRLRRGLFEGYDGAAAANLHNAGDFFSGTIKGGTNGNVTMPEPNVSAMVANTLENLTGWGDSLPGFSTLEEDNFSAYVMAEFEGEGIRGNFGLRYVSTDASTDYYAPKPGAVAVHDFNNGYATTLSTDKASYNDVLPSFNLAIDVADDVILRMSAAQVIARPNYNDMFGNSSLAGFGDNIPGNETVVRGNVELKPYKATQADFGVEWYYAEGSLLSAAYFIKDVSNFTTFANTPNQSIGIVDPDTGEDSWLVQSLEDGEGGTIEGFEIQSQHDFQNGFGTVFNYTYADAEADASNFEDGNAVFSDSSEHTVNLVGYYENETFSARAAYTWRSEYMIRETGFYGNREHQDFGSLDLSLAWYATDNIEVTFDVTNLLEEEAVQVGRDQGPTATELRTSNGYPSYSYEGEARFTAGVNFRF